MVVFATVLQCYSSKSAFDKWMDFYYYSNKYNKYIIYII